MHRIIMSEALETESRNSVNSTDPAIVKLLDMVPVGINASVNGVYVTNPHANVTVKVLARSEEDSVKFRFN